MEEIIQRWVKLGNKAEELAIKLGIGESIPEIVKNIIENNVKEQYKKLTNSICEYCATNDLILNTEVYNFIFENKKEDTYEKIIQPCIDKAENNSELDNNTQEAYISLFNGDSNFIEGLKVCIYTALTLEMFDIKSNQFNTKIFKISRKLEAILYKYAIAYFGIKFIEIYYTEFAKYSDMEEEYAGIIESAIRQGLVYTQDLSIITILNRVFGPVLLNSNNYRKFITDSECKKEFDKIVRILKNTEYLDNSNIDRERREFWQDYIIYTDFDYRPEHGIFIISFDKYVIVEYVDNSSGYRAIGYTYILKKQNYDNLMYKLDTYRLGFKKVFNEYFEWHKQEDTEARWKHGPNWKYGFRDRLNNEYNLVTDKSKTIYNTKLEERRKLTPSLRLKIIQRDNYKCHYCGKNLYDEKFHIDHLIPVSRGGKTVYNNLAAACPRCNLSKGAKTEQEFMGETRRYL